MAVLNIVLTTSASTNDFGDSMPVTKSRYVAQADVTTTASASTTGSPVAPAQRSYMWAITCSGGNARVLFGTAPVVSASTGHLLLDGQTRWFAVTDANEIVSYING